MSCTIRDASLTTARRRQLALYAWRQSDQYPQNPQSIRPEQGGTTSEQQCGSTSDVSVAARIGAQLVGQSGSCSCSSAVTLQGYDKKAPASG